MKGDRAKSRERNGVGDEDCGKFNQENSKKKSTTTILPFSFCVFFSFRQRRHVYPYSFLEASSRRFVKEGVLLYQVFVRTYRRPCY